jgi:hypothetical protein
MIPELSKNFKDHNIIIRPHPSENHDIWKKIAKNYPNVFVVHSGNVIPWIMSADVLIHNGCTTAIEAYLLGIRAVAYRPLIVEDLETKFPNEISVQTYNIEELVDVLDKMINKNIDFNNDNNKSYLDLYLSGFNGRAASEKIVSILRSRVKSSNKKINNFLFIPFEILSFARKIVNKILLKRDKNLISVNYQLHKTPSLTKKDIVNVIENLSEVNKSFLNLKIKRIGGTCYYIYSKNNIIFNKTR